MGVSEQLRGAYEAVIAPERKPAVSVVVPGLNEAESLPLLAQQIKAALGETPYETVGGLVFAGFGHLPEPGEELHREGLAFEVLSVGDRRIRSVRVRRSSNTE